MGPLTIASNVCFALCLFLTMDNFPTTHIAFFSLPFLVGIPLLFYHFFSYLYHTTGTNFLLRLLLNTTMFLNVSLCSCFFLNILSFSLSLLVCLSILVFVFLSLFTFLSRSFSSSLKYLWLLVLIYLSIFIFLFRSFFSSP